MEKYTRPMLGRVQESNFQPLRQWNWPKAYSGLSLAMRLAFKADWTWS